MIEFLDNILADGAEHLNIILLMGLAIFFGMVVARIFQRLRIPQIIGYISIGIILGPLLNIISRQTVQAFEPFNMFALGIIGFLIGGELKHDIFAKFGRQVFTILLFEGGVAFLFVVVSSFFALFYFYDWQTALAVGLVFGAICSATDPASTVNILWEYKTRGPLTTMLIAIVALDDALALLLYITSVSLAGFLTGHREVGVLKMMVHSLYEISGSLGLGLAAGLLLHWILRRLEDDEKTLVLTIGIIVLTVGLAMALKLDVILSSMACGVSLINISPRRSLKSFELVRKFSPPIYVLFFVIIGSRLSINTTGQIWLLAAVYVLGTIFGKTAGSYWGAVYSKAVSPIRKYLGFCLYQQGTIAIALLIMASHRFEGQIKDMMLSVIIVGVFIVQLLGPLFVKIGIKKAGEIGMNVTEEDLIKTYKVADVMDTRPTSISQDLPLHQILEVFSASDSVYYPVIDKQSRIIGIITIADIKEMFANREVAGWLLACDVAEPVLDKTTPQRPLEEALEQMRRYDLENMLVVAGDDSDELVGVLDYRKTLRKISAEVLHRRKKADEMALATG